MSCTVHLLDLGNYWINEEGEPMRFTDWLDRPILHPSLLDGNGHPLPANAEPVFLEFHAEATACPRNSAGEPYSDLSELPQPAIVEAKQ